MQNGKFSEHETEKYRLTEELNVGAEQIAALESELESCRRETLRLRSKAASVSLSFESLKDELQAMLQSEAGLMTNSLPPPSSNEGKTLVRSPSNEEATLCALNGQLEATKLSVKKAVHERDELLRQMSEEESILVGPDDAYASGKFSRDVSVPSLFQSTPGDADSKAREKNSFAMNLIEKLNAQASTSSSFRDDHARIWRDSTLPNVALLKWSKTEEGSLTPDSATCGVVSERLFAGITLYTSSNADGDVEDHCYLSSCGDAKKVTLEEFNAVKGQYCTLLVEDPSMTPDKIKIIAPRQALERVVELIKSAASHSIQLPKAVTEADTLAIPADLEVKETVEKISEKPHGVPKPQHRIHPGPRLSATSHVLLPEHFQFLVSECIPVRFQECDLMLKYSTNNDGMSVHTLYDRVKSVSPTIVALRDGKGRVFGAYAASAWKPSHTRYYGTGECFVFSCKPRLAVYKWNRQNHFFQFSHGNVLAMGGGSGSHYALWIDEDLVAGTTAACSTFDSPPLTNKSGDTTERSDFNIVVLEVWTIVPRSHAIFNDAAATS